MSKTEETAFIDLHGFTVEDAELELIDFLESLPKTVRYVEVSHGYSRGTALKKMLREQFYHWRVKDVRVGLNPGASYLWLK